MVQSTHSRRLLAAALLLASVSLAACSGGGDSNPTGPPAAKELDSPTLGSSGVYMHTFATAGTFPYHCEVHPSMTASVTVDAASANTNLAISITDNAFNPSAATVKPGGVVTWTNNGNSSHTVTSD